MKGQGQGRGFGLIPQSPPNLAVDFFSSTDVVSEGAATVATAGSLPVDILVRD